MKRFLHLILTGMLLGAMSMPPAQALAMPADPSVVPVASCTLYLTQHRPVDPEAVRQILPKAQLSYLPARDNWEQVQIRYDTQIVTLRRHSAKSWVDHEKKQYFKLLPYLDNDRNLMVTRDLGRKGGLVKHLVEVSSLDTEDPDWPVLISALAQIWHGTVLYRDEVLDDRLRVLLARRDDWEDGSEVPYLPSALARRAKIENLLLRRKIPIFKNLPPVVAEEELVTRPARQVMERAVTLLILGSTTTTITRPEAAEMLERWGLMHELTPSEYAFLTKEVNDEEVKAGMNLRFEAAYALLWALGVVPGNPNPGKPSNLQGMISRIKGKNFNAWFDSAKLRPRGEILDQLDLVYRLSWAKKTHGERNYKPLLDLQSSLVHQWYYALSWVTGPDNGWDKAKTDF